MSKIKVLGVDPAFANVGIALVEVDLITRAIYPTAIDLIQTEKTKHKQVRVSSDNLRRATELNTALREWEKKATVMIAEIPSGGKSAKAVYGFGIAVGVLGGHTIPLIEVTPTEVKKAVTGYSDASKADMIAWATETYPNLPWAKGRGKQWADSNEHMADALAIIEAGIRTQQFEGMTAVLKSVAAE